MPGIATIPKACLHPKAVAIMPPSATPIALPSVIDEFHNPIIQDLLDWGYMAEIKAEPPGAYPASPTPITVLTMNNCLNVMVNAPTPVATPQTRDISPIVFFRLQRSINIETGNVNNTIDQ